MENPDCSAFFPDTPEGRDALEAFVRRRVGPRLKGAFDGLGRVREIERGPDALRLAGWVWTLGDGEQAFWLEIEREPGGELRWTMHFGALESSERRARHTIDLYERPGETRWRVVLSGSRLA